MFWDGVSGRGGYDPLAHGAKSSSSDTVKGQLWRIQPEAEGAGSPCASLFSGIRDELEFRLSLGGGKLHYPQFHGCHGLIFLTQTISVSRSGFYPEFLQVVKIYFLEEV